MAILETRVSEEIQGLRQGHYNAELVELIQIHDELRIFRVRPDWGVPRFEPGQYVALGLGFWEERVAGVQAEELTAAQRRRLVKRAYSVSCPVLDRSGKLARCSDLPYLEFYITLVRYAARRAPALTPRLFLLQPGDRLFVEPKVVGRYTLEGVGPGEDVFFLATGTGEAPHNAMLAELLARGHTGRIVSSVCVRNRQDLGYLATQRQLEQRYPNYCYLPLTTREPENEDPSLPNYVGKVYMQDYAASGALERDSGAPLDPASAHVFLCGNPAMIGIQPDRAGRAAAFPQPLGMLQVLQQRGFRVDSPPGPGLIRFEKYW